MDLSKPPTTYIEASVYDLQINNIKYVNGFLEIRETTSSLYLCVLIWNGMFVTK